MTHSPTSPIQQRLMEFIRREFRPGFNHYSVSKLMGDASSRQYFRYLIEPDQSFILAVYPEPFDPRRFPYKQVYDLLVRLEIPVPEIVKLDGDLGIVLQQDLGNETLQKYLLTAATEDRRKILKQAIDYIIALQKEGSQQLDPESEPAKLAFDEEKLSWELRFFQRHYLDGYRRMSGYDQKALSDEFSRLAAELAAAPRFLCHRDYHVRNLMLKKDQLYVIDFQDARWGAACYDLVSLLKDSIELEPEEVESLTDYYRSRASHLKVDIERQFHLMTIQRLLKALGTFGYQVVVRENYLYEQYMGGSLHRALLALQAIPEFPYIQSVIAQELTR